MATIRYVSQPGTYLVKHRGNSPSASGSVQLLLGGRLHVDDTDVVDGWIRASTVPDEDGNARTGFVETANLSEKQQLKIFYLDVGQGDGTLIKAEGAVVIIDGGPNRGFFDELTKRLTDLQRADMAIGLPKPEQLHINARCNGEPIVMGQKKERPSLDKTWHSFKLPYLGPSAD